MAGNPRRADGNRRNKLRRWLASQGRACWICTHPIDYGLPPNHPLSFECDELVPVSVGGSPFDRDNVDAAHRCCNNWRSTRTPDTVAMIRQAVWEAYGDPGGPLEFVECAKSLASPALQRSATQRIETSTDW